MKAKKLKTKIQSPLISAEVETNTRNRTEAELEMTDWWWRRLAFLKFDQITFTTQKPKLGGLRQHAEFQQWEEKFEIAAWRYELVRRLHREKQYPHWIDLSTNIMCGAFVNALGQNLSRDVCAVCAKDFCSPVFSFRLVSN
jgi:hypothetical protein